MEVREPVNPNGAFFLAGTPVFIFKKRCLSRRNSSKEGKKEGGGGEERAKVEASTIIKGPKIRTKGGLVSGPLL